MSNPRSGAVYVRDLLNTAPSGVCLYCTACGGEYSATRGDYFWMPFNKPFRCQTDRTLLKLVQKRTTRHEIRTV